MDIVRCLVVYDEIGDLIDAFGNFMDKYRVCRVKNNFYKNSEVLGNYRCIMINVIYQDPQNEKFKMICEVQMTLREIFNIRKKMHATYKVFRSVLPDDDIIL